MAQVTASASGNVTFFSPDYATARERFRQEAESRGFVLSALPINARGPSGEVLTIDAAYLGSERPERVLVISSGLHGVEGFFGSAAQLCWLEKGVDSTKLAPGNALLLLHALNPYGFAWLRRFNEHNFDLNRNFLVNGENYQGSPPLYEKLNALLNPPNPPTWPDLFLPRAMLLRLRYGNQALKAAVARGQFDYPQGIFFGGDRPAQLHRILAEHLPKVLADARQVLHVDFHTGLGPWGTYKLLIEPDVAAARMDWLAQTFGTESLEQWDPAGISYPTKGDLGTWCRTVFEGRIYDFVCAEFGTYPGLKVLSALRKENQAHHWLSAENPAYQAAKIELSEAFSPADHHWREETIAQAYKILERGCRALFDGT